MIDLIPQILNLTSIAIKKMFKGEIVIVRVKNCSEFCVIPGKLLMLKLDKKRSIDQTFYFTISVLSAHLNYYFSVNIHSSHHSCCHSCSLKNNSLQVLQFHIEHLLLVSLHLFGQKRKIRKTIPRTKLRGIVLDE